MARAGWRKHPHPHQIRGAPVARGFGENFSRYDGWEDLWQAEIDAEAEAAGEPADPDGAPSGGATAERGRRRNTGTGPPRGAVRLARRDRGRCSGLAPGAAARRCRLERAYIEVALGTPGSQEQALLQRSLIEWSDPIVQRLYLAIDSDLMRRAPRKPYPAGGEADRRIPLLEGWKT